MLLLTTCLTLLAAAPSTARPPKAPAVKKAPPTPPQPPPEAVVAPPAAAPPEAPAAPPPTPTPKTVEPALRTLRVAIVDVRAVGDVPPRALAALNQSLTPELRKLAGISAINSAEVRDMLTMERQKQLLGCGDESPECFAEMAGALDADEMLTFDLTLVGQTYALGSRRFDLRKSRVVQTRLEKFDKRDGEELLAIVGPTLGALYPERSLKPGKTWGVEAAVIRRLNPPPLPKWTFFTTAGLGVAAAGVGGVFGFLSSQTQAQATARLARSVSEPINGTELNAMQTLAKTQAFTANALFIGAGALGLVAIIEALFTDWLDDRAAFASPVAFSGGAGLVAAWAY